MGNKKKKERHRNIENNDKDFHKEKRFGKKNYNVKRKIRKLPKWNLKKNGN